MSLVNIEAVFTADVLSQFEQYQDADLKQLNGISPSYILEDFVPTVTCQISSQQAMYL